MTEWFSGLSPFQQTYWVLTGIASLFFLVVLMATFIGADGDDIGDVDAEIEVDTGVGFQFFTFKNLVAFFAIFGWSGIASMNAGNTKTTTVLISITCGLLMVFVMASLFYYISKLTSSGTLRMNNALHAIGEVYLTVGANRSRIGKIQIKVQGALRELEALTDHFEDLKQGKVVKVTEVTNNGILIIEPQK
jgi:hypothetical protein